MFSLLYNHMKISIIVFSFTKNCVFVLTGVTMFLQWPKADKPNTGPEDGLSCFLSTIVSPSVLEGKGETRCL